MDIILSYLLKSMVCSGILVAYYRLALRNKKQYGYNRVYLLLTAIISLVFPLLHFDGYSFGTAGSGMAGKILSVLAGGNDRRFALRFTWEWVALTGSIAISLTLLIQLFLRIGWIYRIRRRHRVIPMKGFKLIETKMDQAPFSFLDNLFWREDISLSDPDGEKIFKHELIHIRGRHTYDKLFMQVIVCICWMNPFFWIVQKELELLHEFIADDGSVGDGDPAVLSRLLLLSCYNGGNYYNEGKFQEPFHSFFASPVKRRLFMLAADKQVSFALSRRAGSLVVAGFLFFLFAFTTGKTGDNLLIPKPAREKISAPYNFDQKRLDEAKAARGEIYKLK